MSFPDLLVLDDIQLEPFHERHEVELRALEGDDAIFHFHPDDVGPFAAWMNRWIGAARASTDAIYIVRQSGSVVGSTRFMNIALEHARLEIGGTFYLPARRRTHTNSVCKKVLLEHAFDVLRLNRVELRCDARNLASRGAIAKLLAKEEGTLRHHIVCASGHLRDTVSFAILREEWPEVRTKLEARIAFAAAFA